MKKINLQLFADKQDEDIKKDDIENLEVEETKNDGKDGKEKLFSESEVDRRVSLAIRKRKKN